MGLGQYQLLLNKGVHPYTLPLVTMSEGVPKNIYQTYSSWDKAKPEWKHNIEKIIELKKSLELYQQRHQAAALVLGEQWIFKTK